MILPRDGESPIDGRPAGPPVETAEKSAAVLDPSAYTVQLDQFEGPLDLLLYLIQRDEIDIYDIPIAHITEHYLAYIDQIHRLDLENAGEFLVMASTLMRIKARLLLPVQRAEDDEDEGDPRDELVRRLLEYKKYKEASGDLAAKEESRRDWFRRGIDFPFKDQIEEDPPEFSLSMFDLLSSVGSVLEQLRGDHQHHVFQEIFTVEEQSRKLSELLRERGSIRFEEIFRGARVKMEVVVTFVAMLELMKQGHLSARQLGPYREIWLYPPERGEAPTLPPSDDGGDASKESHAA